MYFSDKKKKKSSEVPLHLHFVPRVSYQNPIYLLWNSRDLAEMIFFLSSLFIGVLLSKAWLVTWQTETQSVSSIFLPLDQAQTDGHILSLGNFLLMYLRLPNGFYRCIQTKMIFRMNAIKAINVRPQYVGIIMPFIWMRQLREIGEGPKIEESIK